MKNNLMVDRSTIRLVLFACCIIVLAIIITSAISYGITENAIVDKLKSRDMVYIVRSMAEKIDGRIERACETAELLSDDPTIIKWIQSGGTDAEAGNLAKEKITGLGEHFEYAKAFLASDVTHQYWENNAGFLALSPEHPTDEWFYRALQSKQKTELNINYDSIHQETFLYLNVLIGDLNRPLGVAGVALSLKDIAAEFSNYKFGEKSNLWLVDKQGKIHLADDLSYNGQFISTFLPENVTKKILEDTDTSIDTPKVLEYQAQNGTTVDLAYQPTAATDWKLVFQISRSESVAILDTIKLNGIIASVITLLLMVFVFYFVSYKIANPFQRAVRLAAEMEKQVQQRTHELAEKNERIMDSITYAKRLQEAILPRKADWQGIGQAHFVLWRPRDIVGGDFYWIRQLKGRGSLIIVGDCTGHGVPGALMTMTVNSILNHIVDSSFENTGQMLRQLNILVKKTLHPQEENQVTDDGLDIAICHIEGNQLEFTGAKIPLYVKRDGEVHVLKGDNRSIGYRHSKTDGEVSCHHWELKAGDRLYLTTDGYTDQNGGEKNYPMGKKAFIQWIVEQPDDFSFEEQRESLEKNLAAYSKQEPQRDDITVVGVAF